MTTAPAGSRSRMGVATSIVAIVVAIFVGLLMPAPVAAAGPAPATSALSPVFDKELVTLINQARASKRLPLVRSASGLAALSTWWSNQLATGATGGTLRHNPNAWTQVLKYGAANRLAWGENVAKLPPAATAKQLFDAYMASPTHRANILGKNFRYVGTSTRSNGVKAFNTMTFTDRVLVERNRIS